jgi:hypothetical protein
VKLPKSFTAINLSEKIPHAFGLDKSTENEVLDEKKALYADQEKYAGNEPASYSSGDPEKQPHNDGKGRDDTGADVVLGDDAEKRVETNATNEQTEMESPLIGN